MNFVEPIRSKKQIKQMKKLLKQQSLRDYFLFYFGINTGLRISDILPLRVCDVRDRTHLVIKEKKTGKRKQFALNDEVQKKIKKYTKKMEPQEYLFASEQYKRPITRVRAYQIINAAAQKLGLERIGTHTLRKSYGFHFYQRTKDIATLQLIFNHSHPSITLRYIGLTQDMIDAAVRKFNL